MQSKRAKSSDRISRFNGKTEVTIPYRPRGLQSQLHELSATKRFGVIVVHRRFGKTVFAINDLIRTVMTAKHQAPRVAYVAPTYAMAKRIAWDYAKYYCDPIPNLQINESELRIDFPNRGRLSLYGAENEDSLRGLYLHKVVLDEYAFMSPKIWSTILRPALADTKGSAIFMGTPFGNNHFRDMYEYGTQDVTDNGEDSEWFSVKWDVEKTKIIDKDELDSLKKEMDPSDFEQEFECSFDVAVRGSFYGRQMEKALEEKRITNVPYDPEYPVITSWDLGMRDSTCIWFFQRIGPALHAIDFEENTALSLTEYVNILKDKEYNYSVHVLPHDATVRELQTGKTRLEALQNMNMPCLIAPRIKILDGIDASRKLLNKVWFDKNNCDAGINALKNYRTEWDEKNRIYKTNPRHDWASHPADSFRTYAVAENLVKGWVDFSNVSLDEIERSLSYDHII